MASPLALRGNEVSFSDLSPQRLAGTIIGVILSFSACSILSCFLIQKLLAIKTWRRLPYIFWLVFAVYIDSWIFVFATGIINYGIGVDSNLGACSSAIILYREDQITFKDDSLGSHSAYAADIPLSCRESVLFSALVIQWVTSRDNTDTDDSSPNKHHSYHPPPPPPKPQLRHGQKLCISRPLKTVSTSQYEHIFGDLEPEPESDIVSASILSTSISHNKAASSRFDYDTDYDSIPITENPEEEDISMAADLYRNGKDVNRDWGNTSILSETGASSVPEAGASTAVPAPETQLQLQPFPQLQLQPQPRTPTPRRGRGSPAVSIALSADMERIRRYKGRRQQWSSSASASASTSTSPPTPTSTSMPPPTPTLTPTSKPTTPTTPMTPKAAKSTRSTRGYRISQLAFEGEGDSRWYDLVGMEEGGDRDGEGQSRSRGTDDGGWI
ncbi:hypothetical protein F5Y06DRAFT_291334 [Hypoxylon sp. FL0890]|nr:hypothetical protein F5Y06DRAFT_291334 [Hypoxylon sp. FL0890]